MTIYDEAREALNSAVIQKLFPDPDAKIEKDEYYIKSPLRADKEIGSFSINLNTGYFNDFSTGDKGDFIKLLSSVRAVDKKEAARIVVYESGRIPESEKKKAERPKGKKNIDVYRPELPIKNVSDAVDKLKKRVASKWSIDRFGPSAGNWAWRDDAGGVLWVIVRHKSDQGKQDIPYYFSSDDGKWHQGIPFRDSRPLYGISRYKKEKNILIVEGQKCADVLVSGWFLTTWAGGVNAVNLSDWKKLKSLKPERVVIWPDNDIPGKKAAFQIKEKLSGLAVEIIDIQDRPEKWDIFDAMEQGEDLLKIVETWPRASAPPVDYSARDRIDPNIHPFIILGYTDRLHYFLPHTAPLPFTISRGNCSMSNSQMMELAPTAWWAINFPAHSSGGIDRPRAADWIIQESHKKGFFNSDQIRGAGVWRDNGDIVINTGKEVITKGGDVYQFSELKTKHIYVMSDKRFGELSGETSNDEQGRQLINLFLVQQFHSTIEAIAACGWALIAPFSSFLKWRPHVWLTGKKGIGKSFLIEDVIQPLVGPIAHTGSGRDTEAGIRRDVRTDGCPIILDETEPRNADARKRIDGILELARNAASDASAEITIASSNGGVDKFRMRQSFLFSSIVQYMDSPAIASRFVLCRLDGKIDFKKKKDETKAILKMGILKDPGIYRRRIFKMLDTISENIEFLRNFISKIKNDQRQADKLAPLFAAVYAVANPGKIKKSIRYQECINDWLTNFEKDSESDEDALIREILDAHIRHENGYRVVGELISDVVNVAECAPQVDTLSRYGIRYLKDRGEIAIAYNHRAMRELLKETIYFAKYGEILKRHDAAGPGLKNVFIAGSTPKCVILNYSKIKDIHMEKADNYENEIPF